MTERLKNCDKWHPDTPSRLITHRMGEHRTCVRCAECVRMRVLAHRDTLKAREVYGVLPRLTWIAPEFMT